MAELIRKTFLLKVPVWQLRLGREIMTDDDHTFLSLMETPDDDLIISETGSVVLGRNKLENTSVQYDILHILI